MIDPTGMSADWVPDKDGNLLSEEGDNALTLSTFLSISYHDAEDMIANQDLEFTGQLGPAPNVEKDQALKLDNQYTKALAIASDDGTIDGQSSNCHGCSYSGSLGNDIKGVLNGGELDEILANEYNAVEASDAKFGETIIRYGGTNTFAPGEYNVNNHTVVFYGQSRDGTNYAFSKPGFTKRPEIIRQDEVSNPANQYGRVRGSKYGESGYYNRKK